MTTPNFGTENQTYRQLMGNGTVYQVPPFQRDYSWGEEQWEDLWLDIEAMVDSETPVSHYMGYLVLQQEGNARGRLIIDGQQRLTTLTILVLSALRVLEDRIETETREEDSQRIEEIRRVYVGSLDTVSLKVSPKLRLNRNNDSYFQTYVLPMRKLPARNLRASEHSIRKASEYFEKRVSEYIVRSNAQGEAGAKIAAFVEAVADGLFFTVITVTDELNAYTVFETLNARGVKLAAPDLLKNYLFAVISKDVDAQHGEELDDLDRRWSEILSRLSADSLTSYLRIWWGSRYSFVRQAELFKTIRRSITSRAEAYSLISGMEDDLDIFLSLSSPETSGLHHRDTANAERLKMFSVRQPFSLLLAVNRMIPDEFSKILRVVVNMSFRYNIIGSQSPAEQERTYARVATRVSNGEIDTGVGVIEALRGIYLSDSAFEAAFREKSLDTSNSRNKRVVRYILDALESFILGKSGSPAVDGLTIEHILPEAPADNWPEFDDQEKRAYVYRLGNMTPIEQALNQDARNSSFNDKKPIFAQSGVNMTKEIANLNEWNAQEIRERQSTFAKAAKSIWRVDQLH